MACRRFSVAACLAGGCCRREYLVVISFNFVSMKGNLSKVDFVAYAHCSSSPGFKWWTNLFGIKVVGSVFE